LIAAKEKTMWNTRRVFSDEGGGDEDNGANPRQFPAKTNGDKGKVEKIIVAMHSHIPTTTSTRTTRSSGGHPEITRVVHAGIEFVLIYSAGR
jgi:hypothetical protein